MEIWRMLRVDSIARAYRRVIGSIRSKKRLVDRATKERLSNPAAVKLFTKPALRPYELVNFAELELLEKSDDERANFASEVYTSAKTIRELVKIISAAQIKYWTRNAFNDKQLAFHNGLINGYDLLLEAVEKWEAEHLDNITPKVKEDIAPPIPSSGSNLVI